MVSETASEIPSQPRMSEVSIRPSVEFNPRLSTQESKAADSITSGLNSGKPPEDIMRRLLNQKTTKEQNTQPQPDTQPENKTQPNKQGETGYENNQSDTGADGDNNIRSAQDQEGGDADSNEQLNETEEDKFKAAVEEHMQKYGLQAPNLEADGRFQDIHEKLMKDWEEQNPEPYKGRGGLSGLSHEEKMKWIDWAVRKDEYGDRAFSEARVIFKKTYEKDFDKYEKYGIYDSLKNDPRFEKILGRETRVQYKLAIERPDIFQHPAEIAFVHSLDEFIGLYPEVAEVYAIKDENVARVLKIRKEKNQQHTQPQPDTQPNEQRKTGREDNQINTGEDGDNRRSGQDREGADANSNKERTNNEPNKPEQETEIQELKKQIEALTQEIKELRKELEQLKELEAQAGKIFQHLKENPQIAKLFESQGAGATGNKPLESKQSNISKLLEILILLLLAAGGFAVGSEAKKT